MPSPITTLVLVLLTILALAGCVVAVRRWRADPARSRTYARVQAALVGLCIVGSAALLVGRWAGTDHGRGPIDSHLDGLLLVTALLGASAMYVQSRARLPGLSAFALPVMALVLAWSICASAWTYQPFGLERHLGLDAIALGLHLAGVYLGTVLFAMAAVAGAMYLWVERRLRRKVAAAGGPLGSLEGLERLIIRTSALGFALLTLGLLTGLIVLHQKVQYLGPDWWHAPKVLLGMVAWLVFALVMNVRHATAFRGPRAAWLSIAGLVLVLAAFAAAIAMPPLGGGGAPPPSGAAEKP